MGDAICPICNRQFPSKEIEAHANICLDNNERSRQIQNDERLAKRLSTSLSVSKVETQPEPVPRKLSASTSNFISSNSTGNPFAFPNGNNVNPNTMPIPTPYPVVAYPVPSFMPANGYPQPVFPFGYPGNFPQPQMVSPNENSMPQPIASGGSPENQRNLEKIREEQRLKPLPPRPQVTPTVSGINKADIEFEGWMWHLTTSQNPVKSYVVLTKEKLVMFYHGTEEITLKGATVTVNTNQVLLSNGKFILFTFESKEAAENWAETLKKYTRKIEGWAVPKEAVNNEEKLKKIDQTWIHELTSHPEDENILIPGHLKFILTHPVHRFGKLINKFTSTWQKKFKKAIKGKTVSEEDFEASLQDIQIFINNLISALNSYFNGLEDISPNANYLCTIAIQELIFGKIYGDLMTLFRKKYHDEDVAHDKKFKELLTISAAHLGIPEFLWLIPDPSIQTDGPPYHKAISNLQKLPSYQTAESKINCLVTSAKMIVTCVNDYYTALGKPKKDLLLGGDEMLPLFAYILLKAGIPYIYSESQFMERFIHSKASLEQSGYIIATLSTCLQFILLLEKSEMEKSAMEILTKVKRETPMAVPEKKLSSPGQFPNLLDITVEKLEALLSENDSMNESFAEEKMNESLESAVKVVLSPKRTSMAVTPQVDLISFD